MFCQAHIFSAIDFDPFSFAISFSSCSARPTEAHFLLSFFVDLTTFQLDFILYQKYVSFVSRPQILFKSVVVRFFNFHVILLVQLRNDDWEMTFEKCEMTIEKWRLRTDVWEMTFENVKWRLRTDVWELTFENWRLRNDVWEMTFRCTEI